LKPVFCVQPDLGLVSAYIFAVDQWRDEALLAFALRGAPPSDAEVSFMADSILSSDLSSDLALVDHLSEFYGVHGHEIGTREDMMEDIRIWREVDDPSSSDEEMD
jgi:hypothetical protein